jgi:hypothetical protein
MYESDRDYMDYGGSRQQMAQQMSESMDSSSGFIARGRSVSAHSAQSWDAPRNVSQIPLGDSRFEKRNTWNDGKTWVSGGKYVIDGVSTKDVTTKGYADPAFDSLYQPAFQASRAKPVGPGLHNRNSLFEKARSKLNERAGAGAPPKATPKGAPKKSFSGSGGPPKKTWSN